MDSLYSILPKGIVKPENLVFKRGVKKVSKKSKYSEISEDDVSADEYNHTEKNNEKLLDSSSKISMHQDNNDEQFDSIEYKSIDVQA